MGRIVKQVECEEGGNRSIVQGVLGLLCEATTCESLFLEEGVTDMVCSSGGSDDKELKCVPRWHMGVQVFSEGRSNGSGVWW